MKINQERAKEKSNPNFPKNFGPENDKMCRVKLGCSRNN
jgi:hypothetical protein